MYRSIYVEQYHIVLGWAKKNTVFRQSTKSHQNPWNKWEILLNVKNKSTLRWNPSRWLRDSLARFGSCVGFAYIHLHDHESCEKQKESTKRHQIQEKYMQLSICCWVILLTCFCLLLFLPTKPAPKQPWVFTIEISTVVSQSSQIFSQLPDPARLLMEVKVSLCRFPNLKCARVFLNSLR